MSTFDIIQCSVFDIFKPKSRITSFVEKFAILAALFEVFAVLCKILHYPYYEAVVYASLYASVVVTILLPIAKWLDYSLEYKKLKMGLRTNPFDRSLALALLLGACTVIGREKMSDFVNENRCSISNKIRNICYNFWYNTRIYGKFFFVFEELFGKGSFAIFLEKLESIDERFLEIKDIHNLIASFFTDVELWDNHKVLQAMRILNYRSSGEKMISNSDVIHSIDYLLLSYFRYGKSDIIHEIEAIYAVGK